MTATVTESIEHLDFTVEVPCSHSEHDIDIDHHHGPAYVMVRVTCNYCHDVGTVDLCEVFFKGVMLFDIQLYCGQCGQYEPARESYTPLYYY